MKQKFIALLHSKNNGTAIADVIAFLIDNADENGIVKNCEVASVIENSGISNMTVQAAFQLLEKHGYGKRYKVKILDPHCVGKRKYMWRHKTCFQFEDSVFEAITNPQPQVSLIDAYLKLSDLIDKKTTEWTAYCNRNKNKENKNE